MCNFFRCVLSVIFIVAVTGIAYAQSDGDRSGKKESLARLAERPANTGNPGRVERPTEQAQIQIFTLPGSYQILVDDQSMGETGVYGRKLTLPAGQHIFTVQFPNGVTWTRAVPISSSVPNCAIRLNYNAPTSKLANGTVTETFTGCIQDSTAGTAAPGTRCTRIARGCRKNGFCRMSWWNPLHILCSCS